MTWTLRDGPRTWKLSQDKDGQRVFTAKFLVVSDDPKDGPYAVLDAAGLPQPGSSWKFGNDEDLNATCTWEAEVDPQHDGKEPCTAMEVTLKFKTTGANRCQDFKVDNPLLEMMKVNGDGVRFQEEATVDRFGLPIVNSAWEQLRGTNVEFDGDRGQINVEQNVPTLELALCEGMRNTVNMYPLWGMPKRCVKLSKFAWERKFYGKCTVYFTRKFTFDTRIDTFDRNVLDEGQKVLNGQWDPTTGRWLRYPVGKGAVLNPNDGGFFDPAFPLNPNPYNPAHFIRFRDRRGEPSKAVLDGRGMPFIKDLTNRVTTCDRCATGAPNSWRVLGLNPDFKLVYDTQCTWEGSVGADVYTLNFDGEEWTFSVPNAVGYYSLPAVLWRCDGPNLMIDEMGIASPLPLPQAVLLLAGDVPGYIHVEKYQEADFLLLGIPPDLEVPQRS